MGVGREQQDSKRPQQQQQQEGEQHKPSQVAGERSLAKQGANVTAKRFYGAILADDMGLGKTLQAITLLWTLLTNGVHGKPTCQRALVLCPSSLVQNWEAEVQKWLGTRLPATVLDDTRAQVVKDKLGRFCSGFADSRRPQLLIMSYTTYRIHAALVIKKNMDLLTCDEAHQLKNGESQIANAVMELPAKRRLLLSGTPIQNDLLEFYTMVNITNPNLLGDLATFRKRFQTPIVHGRDAGASDAEAKLGAARSEELVKVVNEFMLRRTNTILQELLPPRIEQVVFCRMSALQTQLYQHFLISAPVQAALNSSQASSKGSGALSLSTLPAIGALQKLCCHPDLVYGLCSKPPDPVPEASGQRAVLTGFENGTHVFAKPSVYPAYQQGTCQTAHSGKVMVLESILKAVRTAEQDASNRDKVVVVSNYTDALDILQKMCSANGWPTLRIDGSNSVKQRQPLVNQFNDPTHESFVFLLSSKAAGMGLNIIGANRLVMFDCDWNPANDAQAMARVWREGQQKNVFIYRLLTTGSIEEKIYQRQIAKVGLSKAVMEEAGNAAAVPQFSREELRGLFKIQQDTVCDTHTAITCPCTGHTCYPAGSREESEGLLAWAHLQDASGAADPVWQRMSSWIRDKFVTFLFSDHTVRRKQKPGSTPGAAAAEDAEEDLEEGNTARIEADHDNEPDEQEAAKSADCAVSEAEDVLTTSDDGVEKENANSRSSGSQSESDDDFEKRPLAATQRHNSQPAA
ncbi:hypothetical protein WJX72_004324 [[Myrmecia] bisecta]|uniref:Uncharacterized protein n=1 Tax=[Myrmecia] bisecta TaxID=41462 RepID=A0AAW1QBH5_9CHLO